MNVQEALNSPAGTNVYGLTGTVTEAYPPKSGTSQRGPWTLMDFYVQDATGQKIKVNWWDPQITDHQAIHGQQVQVSAYQNSNGTPVGAKIDHNLYQGQTEVRVQARGKAVQVIGVAPQAQPPAQQQSAPQAAPQAQQQAYQPPPSQGNRGRLTEKQILDATSRFLRHVTSVFPGSDEQAIAATVNTLLIAAANGKFDLDDDDGGTPPF